ncbi:MAG: helix-turn-helix domain-containing protein [bacterium]|nr:helix-turn-helix domain-containing protein [bacterium]
MFFEEPKEEHTRKNRSSKRTATTSRLTFKLVTIPEEEQQNKNPYDLKELREKWNYSVEDVHNLTKIPIKHLIALESGERTFLPPIHVRAFLRTLGNLYNVDWKLLNPPEATIPPLPEIRTLDEIGSEEVKPTFWQSLLIFLIDLPKKVYKKFFSKIDQ